MSAENFLNFLLQLTAQGTLNVWHVWPQMCVYSVLRVTRQLVGGAQVTRSISKLENEDSETNAYLSDSCQTNPPIVLYGERQITLFTDVLNIWVFRKLVSYDFWGFFLASFGGCCYKVNCYKLFINNMCILKSHCPRCNRDRICPWSYLQVYSHLTELVHPKVKLDCILTSL